MVMSDCCSYFGAIWQIMEELDMYSPKISKHSPRLYHLAKAVGKPMTRVADDLLEFGYRHLEQIYDGLSDDQIREIVCAKRDPDYRKKCLG